MRRVKKLLLIMLACWPASVWSANVTLEEALQTALAKNTDIVKAKKDLSIAQAEVEKTYGMFDFKLTGNLNYSDRVTEATSPLAPEETQVLSFGLGLSEKTMLGGFFSLDLNSSRTEWFYPAPTFNPMMGGGIDPSFLTTDLNPSYNPTVSLRYEQPLLKDFWGRPDQIALKIAAISIDLAKIGLKQIAVEQVAGLTNAYLAIVQARAMLEIQKESLQDRETYYNQTVRMQRIGLREDKDIFQTQASFLQAKAGLSNAQDGVSQAKEQFLNLAGYAQQQWPLMEIENSPLFTTFTLPEQPTAEQEKQLAARQPAVRLINLQIQMSELNKKIAVNATLPSLSLFGQYGIEGLDESWNAGFSEMVDLNYNNFAVGINFSLNLPNRTFDSDLTIKQQALDKSRAELAALEKTIMLQVRYAYKQLVSAKEKYDLQQQARQLIEKSLTVHNRHFAQGRITTRELLGAQSEYHGSRMEEINAMIAYLQAINEWKKLAGDYEVMMDDKQQSVVSK